MNLIQLFSLSFKNHVYLIDQTSQEIPGKFNAITVSDLKISVKISAPLNFSQNAL